MSTENLVETFVAAEDLGFDGGWIAQHHLRGDYGRLPSPFVVPGAVAARTRWIELATAVTVLPLEDPIRLAEDVAVLDAFSGGRIQLGLGTGGANIDAFGAWGLDPARRHDRFDASLARLRAALAGEPGSSPSASPTTRERSSPGPATSPTTSRSGSPDALRTGSTSSSPTCRASLRSSPPGSSPNCSAAACSAGPTKAVPSAATWASRDRQAAGTLQARAYRVYRLGPVAVYPTI